eukprot:TRINITY_DN3099_c0_g1_i1.p1 TRINITY_DN3099_c0_g1~~TRINITY_DN3099_c0_g1_i1.p1  ORF type:complete len:666 (+),score=145.51 TRINITY_DN3099_c0_g1_i1:24-2021(+)
MIQSSTCRFTDSTCLTQAPHLWKNTKCPAAEIFQFTHNLLMIDTLISHGSSPGVVGRTNFTKTAIYNVANLTFSVIELEHAIIRGSSISGIVASLLSIPKINSDSPKYPFINTSRDPRLNFAIHYGTVSSPFFHIFSVVNFEQELDMVTRQYLLQHVRVKENKKEIQLPKLMKWHSKEFGKSKDDLLAWVYERLPQSSNLAREVKELWNAGSYSVTFANYNWDFLYVVQNNEKNRIRLGIVNQMMDPVDGVPLADRKLKMTTYASVFSGGEAVDWMISRLPVRTREEAAIFGQKLLDSHFIEAAGSEGNQFKDDGKLFYRFSHMSMTPESRFTSGEEAEVKVTMDDFDILNTLGSGGYGKVLQVRKRDTQKIYAMKIIKKSKIKGDERFIRYERTALMNTNPYLVHLHYSFQTADELCFVMDFIAGGNLMTHMRKIMTGLPRQVAMFVAAELLLALDYLHSVNIIYRDIKPENVLIDRDGHIVLTDFGLSKTLAGENDRTSTIAGTLIYMAPEVLKGDNYGIESDWWGFGVMLYLLLTAYHPFYSESQYEVTERITKKPIDISKCTDKKACDLLEKLLVRDQKKRYTAKQIKKHPFFAEVDWDKLLLKKLKPPFTVTLKGDLDISNFQEDADAQPFFQEISEAAPTQQKIGDFFAGFSYVNKGTA